MSGQGKTISLEEALKLGSQEQFAVVKRDVEKGNGKINAELEKTEGGSRYTNYQKAVIANLEVLGKEVQNLRTGTDVEAGIDINFGEFIQEKLGFSPDDKGGFANLLRFLKLDPSRTTVGKLMSMPELDSSFKWLVPEVIRDAIRTGFTAQPIWNSIIAGDNPVAQKSVTVPNIKRGATPMFKLNEAETIPVGNIEFSQKIITIYKIGTGIGLTDELRQYCSLNLLTEYLQSAGVNLGRGLDTLAVLTLLNGDGNGNAAPVIGTENLGAIDWDNDILRLMIRMNMLGYTANNIIANEEPLRDIMKLPEVKGFNGDTTIANATLKTIKSIPTSLNMFPSGAMPSADTWMFLDVMKALMKFTARPLFIESERIVANQMENTFVTITTGFAKMMQDACVVLDGTQTYASAGFPAYMNPIAYGTYNWGN